MSTRSRRLADVGEHRWLRTQAGVLARSGRGGAVLLGAGDDAAVLRPGRRPWIVTTDAQREGTHFRAGWFSWSDLGRRAFRVNASDVAAMGGLPRAALLALEVPGAMAPRALSTFLRSFAAEARRHGTALVGGDVSAGPRFGATVTLLGALPGRLVTRAGARPGDVVCVTGRLGGTAWAVRERRRGRRVAIPLPPVRLAAGQAISRVASAMVDLSDGLVQDLGHLCRASGVGAVVDVDRLPLAPACARAGAAGRTIAATGGEDYELLFTVAPRRWTRGPRDCFGCPVTPIGTIVAGRTVTLVDRRGRPLRLGRRGFDHFR